MTAKYANTRFTQNRELSWLRFNARVLEEATDETVPLLERLKFLGIFSSNLDEFFMIRVGSLFDLMKADEHTVDRRSGMTPKEQLEAVYAAVGPLYAQYGQVFETLQQQLKGQGISQLSYEELEEHERKFARQYFKTAVAPILSPQIIDIHHPFPHLRNKVIHVAARLRYKGTEVFGAIPLPENLPSVLFIPNSDLRYLRMENLLQSQMAHIFKPYEVLEHVQFCVTRNADINPDDEVFDIDSDFREKMKKMLNRRRRLAIVRLELSAQVQDSLQQYLCSKLSIHPGQIYITEAPLKPAFVFDLAAHVSPDKARMLTYRPFVPQQPANVQPGESMLRQVQRGDILLAYPYERMEPFLRMVREAAFDPNVLSIKITIYRLARKTKLVEYLCAAAESGKDVTVLIELRARFDEQNNIDWSERLEEAGCQLIYGLEEYKVHAKICLITYRERGELRYITQLGTGNYNEKTAALYTDFSLMTARREIGEDASEFFKNMAIGNLYGQYRCLMVAPVSLKSGLLALIDAQIAKGSQGRIFLRLNSLTDVEIMERLQQASCAGVRIRAIIRGICCLLPGIPGQTEQITISSIVGRFLEHPRVYCFGSGAEEQIYLSSADLMTRNTERRVEIACPVYDPAVRQKLRNFLEAAEYDTVKARFLQPDGTYARVAENRARIDSQQLLMDEAERNAPVPMSRPSAGILQSFFRFLKDWVGRQGKQQRS